MEDASRRDLNYRLEQAAARAGSADPAHDILHVRRVARATAVIAAAAGANAQVAVPAALLHELFSYPKGHPRSAFSGEVCAEHAAKVLYAEGVSASAVEAIAYCIRVHPFSLGIVPSTLEAKVLQDADRLDAIGAIGIARVFSTGSAMGRPLYAEDDPFCVGRQPDDHAHSLDHFYNKLLRVGPSLHTDAARAIAAERTRFLHQFLGQLASEIGGSAPGREREA